MEDRSSVSLPALEDMQPVEISIEAAIGSSLVIAENFFGDLFAMVFMLLPGVVLGCGVALPEPNGEGDERGQDA